MREDSAVPRVERRARLMLGAGAAVGVLIAAAGALAPSGAGKGLPRDAVARVNHRTIRSEEYARALEMLRRDKRNPITAEDRVHILDRLIDEELLIQRGVEMGLVDSDRTVRKTIARAMIDSIVAEAASVSPSEEDLKAFYEENWAYFLKPAALRVRQALFRSKSHRGDALARAKKAAEAIAAGMAFSEASAEFGDSPIQPLPDTLLPPTALREYVGPTAVRAILSMRVGDVTPPMPSPYGQQILQLVERRDYQPPPLEKIREQIRAEYTRRAGDRALRDYLDWLKEEADIELSAEAPR